MHLNPVVWFDIYTTDLLRAKRFYESVFAHKLILEQTDGSFEAFRFEGQMPGSGAIGALMRHPMRGPSDQGSIVYFQSPDCELTCSLALAHGGKVFKAKTRVGDEGYIAIIGDSEGNVIGVHSFR